MTGHGTSSIASRRSTNLSGPCDVWLICPAPSAGRETRIRRHVSVAILEPNGRSSAGRAPRRRSITKECRMPCAFGTACGYRCFPASCAIPRRFATSTSRRSHVPRRLALKQGHVQTARRAPDRRSHPATLFEGPSAPGLVDGLSTKSEVDPLTAIDGVESVILGVETPVADDIAAQGPIGTGRSQNLSATLSIELDQFLELVPCQRTEYARDA